MFYLLLPYPFLPDSTFTVSNAMDHSSVDVSSEGSPPEAGDTPPPLPTSQIPEPIVQEDDDEDLGDNFE